MRAVRFDEYGDRDVLYVADVEKPEPAEDRVVVRVVAAAINPGETVIRSGVMADRFPATFPCGEGTDLAGVVDAVGSQVRDMAVGDPVYGWSWERSSQADYAAIPADQLVKKPTGLGWLEAGSLNVAGTTAWAAVEAVKPRAGETVAVSGAAGGVGVFVTQLLAGRDVRVLAIASASNHDWLREHGAIPIAYGDGLADRLREAAPDGIDAFIDLFGPEYLDLAVELEVAPERINTIIAFEKAQEIGAKAEGSAEGTSVEVMTKLGDLVAAGELEVPIAATFPLEEVREAFAELERRHTRGKIVLVIDPERVSGDA